LRREAVAPVRRHVAANLEDELVPVAKRRPAGVASPQDPVSVEAYVAGEAREPGGAECLPPHREEVAERRAGLEGDDAGRVGRPQPRTAARRRDAGEAEAGVAEPDRRGHDHDAPVREQLDMHARRRVQRPGNARAVNGGRRVVARAYADRRGHERERNGDDRKHLRHAIPLVAVVALLAGCGGGAGGAKGITVQAAHAFRLVTVQAGHAQAGHPTRLTYRILQPDGTTLTAFRRGAGPHTGVHLIFVRRDLSEIVHRHPAIAADGTFTDTVVFPAPGPYRLVIDVYPAEGPQPNFQLFSTITVPGTYTPEPLPPLQTTETADGYRFALLGRPHLRAIEAAFMHFTVTAPDGKPASFTPWFGALAHAIFFRHGSLDYFHTHVCAPSALGCTSVFGATRVTGTSATPGKLTVGVLVPLAGEWRLFLQCRVNGHVITAPFTLRVS
jgi:hypothetical protein